MIAARVISILFAVLSLIGIVWFIDTSKSSVVIPGLITIACALIVSMAPRKYANSPSAKWVLIALCFLGVSALCFMIRNDYGRAYGPDYGAIILRIIFASTFIAIGVDLYKTKTY